MSDDTTGIVGSAVLSGISYVVAQEQPTMQLRWVRRWRSVLRGEMAVGQKQYTVLQQRWVVQTPSSSRYEWRDVPEEDETP